MSGKTPLPSTELNLPLLPLRDVVVFPHMVIPLFVGRAKSIKGIAFSFQAAKRPSSALCPPEHHQAFLAASR